MTAPVQLPGIHDQVTSPDASDSATLALSLSLTLSLNVTVRGIFCHCLARDPHAGPGPVKQAEALGGQVGARQGRQDTGTYSEVTH